MSVIYQHGKRTAITYAYESVAYRDSEKKRSYAKRTLIGRMDKNAGEIVPTDGHNRHPKKLAIASELRCFYGATYLLNAIG